MRRMFLAVGVLATAVASGGCAAKRIETTGERAAEGQVPPAGRAKPAEVAATSVEVPGLAPVVVYYELDSARLSDASQLALQGVASALRANRGATVTLSGHTCELGTEEYNMALGYKRANAAREYLVRLGVQEAQVSVTSYGELRPAVPGAGEAQLARNRRTEVTPSRALSSAR